MVSAMIRIIRKQNERAEEDHCKIADQSKIHFPTIYD